MISVQEALDIIQNSLIDLGSEEVVIKMAKGRILAEDICADRDFPPFDRVMMDGIAISYSSIEKHVTSFTIQSVQAAGESAHSLKNTNNCIEIMTGAVLPLGADTVIRYEDIDIKDSIAYLKDILDISTVLKGKNIHPKGTDKRTDDILIKAPKRINAADIGILATVGKARVKVKRLPKVAVISTGDELVKVDAEPLEHQIRMSNSYSVKSVLESLNVQADIFHLKDEKEELSIKIAEIIEAYDLLVFSGAVSKGKFDYLPEVLESLAVEKLFHKVAQRPGKPFWFGRVENGSVVFALPGNPVSTYMCTLRYVLPWLRHSLGLKPKECFARLIEDFAFKPVLTYFLQVSIQQDVKGITWAEPKPGQGSGDLANLSLVDGFLELPSDKTEFKKGETYPLIRFE